MRCTNCGNEQASGKFCGKCGTVIVHTVHTASTQISLNPEHALGGEAVKVATVNESVQLENLKEKSMAYWDYFLRNLKQPVNSFNSQPSEFMNGIISLLIFAAIFAFSIYKAANAFLKMAMTGFMEFSEPGDLASFPFSSVFFNIFVFVLIAMAIVMVSLIVAGKYFGPDQHWKKTLVVYSAHSLPAIVIGVAALALIMMNSLLYGVILLIASLLYSVLLAPGYVMSVILSRSPKKLDPLMGYTVYTALLFGLFTIAYKFIGKSSFMNTINEMKEFL